MDQNIVRGKASVSLSGAAYTGTLSVADTAYVDGGKYIIQPTSNSANTSTLNLNSIGAIALVKPGLVPVGKDDLISGRKYEVVFNSSSNVFEVLNIAKVIKVEYDFAVSGGAVGTLDLSPTIPIGILLRTSEVLIEVPTGLTSAGLSILKWGLSTFADVIDVERPMAAYPSTTNISFYGQQVPYGSFDITGGAAGSINTVSVNGINQLNGSVAFNTSIAQTAIDVKNAINANPNNGNFRATSSGATIYLYLRDRNKIPSSNLTVAATATTLTVGNYNNIGSLGTGLGNVCEAYRLTGAATVRLTIAGADLTGGKIRLWIPYEIQQ